MPAPRAENTKRKSMRLLANRLPAPRTEIAGFSVSPNRCVCPPQEMLRTAYGDDLCGQYMMCQHVLTDRIISNFAYGTDRFYRPPIRVHVLSAEARLVGRECKSIRLLTNRSPAPRAEIADSAVSPIGCGAPSAGANTSFLAASRVENTKRKNICLMKSRLTAPRAEITHSAIPPIRVHVLSAEARVVSRECESMCLLTNRPPAPRAEMTGCTVSTIGYSAACRNNRFRRPIIRV